MCRRVVPVDHMLPHRAASHTKLTCGVLSSVTAYAVRNADMQYLNTADYEVFTHILGNTDIEHI